MCTPFTYMGDDYDECEANFPHGTGYWCLTNGQTGMGSDYSDCGECVDDIEYSTPVASTSGIKNITQAFEDIKIVKS